MEKSALSRAMLSGAMMVYPFNMNKLFFVCVEVLRPSQPNRVMSSAGQFT